MDSKDGLHVSYYDGTNADLVYAVRSSSGTWTTTTVDSAGTTGRHTSMVLDSLKGIHVVYYMTSPQDLGYAYLPKCP